MTTVRQAAARELTRLPSDDPRAVVVSGRDPGLAAGFLEAAPERRILAPAAASRVAVGAGAAMAGRPTITVLETDEGVAPGPWDLGGALVALTDALPVATAAHGAGVNVLQPAWPTDVGPILHAAIAMARPACLYLHQLDLPERPRELDAPHAGRPRALARGDAATVVASGRLVPAVAEAVRLMAARGVEAAAFELAMLPVRGLTPEDAAAGVLVGGPPSDGASAALELPGRRDLRWVKVDAADPAGVADELLRALRPSRRPGSASSGRSSST